MTKKLTQEEFVERSIARHRQDYNYSLVVYMNNSTKVKIICNKHGIVFEQSPNKHMAGQGCPKCRYEKASASLIKTREEFISDAVSAHPSLYGYSRVDYKGCFVPVEIYCNKHKNYFWQKPSDHINNRGCPLCGDDKVKAHIVSLTSNTQRFSEDSHKEHGDLYSYHAVDYVKAHLPVKIWCNRHGGYFEQSPNSHLAGVGCASCAKTGFSPEKPGVLYIMKCGDITKIGITNLSAEIRSKSISKHYGAEFKVFKTFNFDSGYELSDLETNLLRLLRTKYKRPTAKFQGSSECFLSVDDIYLLDLITTEQNKLKELCDNN